MWVSKWWFGLVMVVGFTNILKAQDSEFNFEAERARLVKFFYHPPRQVLEIQGLESANDRERAFLEFYRDEVWRLSEQINAYSLQSRVRQMLLDRGLYRDDAEKTKISLNKM